MESLTIIQKISIWVIPVILAITLHEAAHAWAANRLGDTTAKMFGRLSLNPIRHISFFGTILVPIIIGIMTHFQFIFGWAKPVPINWRRLKHPRRDTALVAIAGPLLNIIMALLWAAGLKVATLLHPNTNMPALFLYLTSQAGIFINLILAFLNLIPIPPLDGSRVLASLLSPRLSLLYLRLEPFGFLILLLLLLTGALGLIIGPLMSWTLSFIEYIFRL